VGRRRRVRRRRHICLQHGPDIHLRQVPWLTPCAF
jgi:hypothetical protein